MNDKMSGKRNLFIIDDYVDLAEMLADQLEEYFNVSAFTEYSRAKEYLDQNKDELDIILTDFKMPVKNGIEVLTEICQLNPNTTRIILTGYADEKIIKENPDVYHAVIDKNDYVGGAAIVAIIEKVEAGIGK